ncbi:MAG: hypothetical protein ACM3JP_01130 [Betaproteobacteria bacterium]
MDGVRAERWASTQRAVGLLAVVLYVLALMQLGVELFFASSGRLHVRLPFVIVSGAADLVMTAGVVLVVKSMMARRGRWLAWAVPFYVVGFALLALAQNR